MGYRSVALTAEYQRIECPLYFHQKLSGPLTEWVRETENLATLYGLRADRPRP